MKTFCNRLPLICLLMLAAVFMTACELLFENPWFIGKWECKDKLYLSDHTYNTTRTLVLTRKTFSEVYVVQPDNSSSITGILGMKGDLEVKGSKMTFSLTAVGECEKDQQNNCTGNVVWFKKGTDTYNTIIQYMREKYTAEYEADEYYLRLVRDLNNDGDTEDAGEDIEFTRK